MNVKQLKLEGHIVQLGKAVYSDGKGEIVISFPNTGHEYDDDVDTLSFEVDEEQLRYFASHLFGRVRVTFELIPELKIADDGAPC